MLSLYNGVVSEKIVIDLTENIANVGQTLPFVGEYVLDNDLLSYPNATLNKVKVDFDVTFLNTDVNVCGTVTCCIQGYCDRCLTRVDKEIELQFDQTFCKDEAENEDDYVYSTSLLDATKAVSDEIVLSMPSLLLCNDDCKGLCPKCGTNLNEKRCNCDTARENPFSALKNLKF